TKVEETHCCCGSHKEEEKVEETHCCCGTKEEAKVEEEHCCCGTKEEAPKAPTCSCCADMEAEATGCSCTSGMTEAAPKKTFMQKVASIFTYGFGGFLDEIVVNFIVGIVIAALITTLIPTEVFTYFSNPWLQMLLMLVVGIPMYVCSTASIPIAVALVLKGLSPGAAFVFLFAGPVTNVASLTMLTKNLGKKVMAIYLSSVAVCSVFFGFILDLIIEVTNYSGLDNILNTVTGCEEPIYKIVIASIFGVLVLWSLYRRFAPKIKARISRA
ncbi:MAG: permease, partial [Bacillota bacterium]